MKFLCKKADSTVLEEALVYGGNSVHNKRIRELLIAEQFNFCAYTEKNLQPLDSVEVEHFNSALKYNDNYYNYYAVIRNANLYKRDEKYQGASFFENLFFQNEQLFNQRIGFANNIYYEIDENDLEARDFIDFLGLNHPILSQQRSNHVKRLKEIFGIASFSDEGIEAYFSKHKDELSHITAIEEAFNLSLLKLIK